MSYNFNNIMEFNLNIPIENLLLALEEKIEATIVKIIREQSQIKNNNQHDDLLTRKQACALLGISLPTLSKYVAAGKLPYSRIGKKVLFNKTAILESISKVRRVR